MPTASEPKVTFSRVVDFTHPPDREGSSSNRNPRSLHRSSSIDTQLADYSDRTRFDLHFADKGANAYSSAGKRKIRSEDLPLSPQVPLSHVIRPVKHIKKQVSAKREIERRLSEPTITIATSFDPVMRQSSRVMATPLPSHVEVPEPDGHIKYVDTKPGPLPSTQPTLSGTTLAGPPPTINSVTPGGTIKPSTVPASELFLVGTQPTTSTVQSNQSQVPSIPPYQPPTQSKPQAQSPDLPREVVVYEERRNPFTDPANEVIVLEARNTNANVVQSPRVRKRKRSGDRTCLLIFWAICLPPVAVYLVEGVGECFAWSVGLWMFLNPFSMLHACIMVFSYPDVLEAHREKELSPEQTRLSEEQRYEEKMQKKREKARRKQQKKRGEWINVS